MIDIYVDKPWQNRSLLGQFQRWSKSGKSTGPLPFREFYNWIITDRWFSSEKLHRRLIDLSGLTPCAKERLQCSAAVTEGFLRRARMFTLRVLLMP